MTPFSQPVISPSGWSLSGYGSGTGHNPCSCFYWVGGAARPSGSVEGAYVSPSNTSWLRFTVYGGDLVYAYQTVTAPVAGQVYAVAEIESVTGGNGDRLQVDSNAYNGNTISHTPETLSLGHVGAGSHTFSIAWDIAGGTSGGTAYTADIYLSDVYLVPDSPWTPVPTGTGTPISTPTGTATVPSGTATAIAALTQTAVASSFTATPIPIPGAMSTNIPTATECPGGCAVAQLTAIPGLSTRVTVDTSPFSPLQNLSLARSTCAPFGFALVPMPVIHGTPAFGSTTPLSYTWTVPLTANWDDTHPYSNTAIQPCAMANEIPTFVWDFTYWLSVLVLAVGWFLWLIGFVGRLSGEETING